MAVLNNRYTITSTQKLPAGSTFIPASQIKSTTTVQKNTDNYRPISYSSEMKQAAQKLADSGNPVGSYYLWQDNEKATGSAAWMESELKKKGIDLSSKSNTGNAVADFFIEAGKGIIEIPIGLKRTLAAGSLGAVGVSQQSTKQAVKTLSEGTSKAISSTVDSAVDNPGRFTGAVVGGIVLTKGIGKLSAVPKTVKSATPKVTTSKTTTKTNPTITTKGTTGAVTTTTRTISLTAGKRTASISVQKSKTASGTKKVTTAGILNTKTGARTAAQKVTSKTTTVQRGDNAINSMLKSRKITTKESGIRVKSLSKTGVVKQSGVAKRSEIVISKGGNLKAQGVERVTKTETRSGKSIQKGKHTATKRTIKRTEADTRRLTANGKTETRKTGSRQRGTKYTVDGKIYDPTAPKVRRPKQKKQKKQAASKQTTAGDLGVIGTIRIQPKGKAGTGGSHGSKGTGGMMYQTKTRTAGTGTYQTANILRGQQATKTAQKVRGTVVTTKTRTAGTKTAQKQSQTATTTRTQAKTNGSASTTAKTSGNSVKQGTGEKSKQDSKRAVAVVTAHRLTTAQAQKPAQKTKQSELVKRAQAVRKKQKKLLRLSEEEKKKIRKPKTKKSKGYLRSEKRNALSWIDDNSKLMKEKKIKN